MKRTRRKFKSEFKSKVAIEAIKERLTLAELAKKYELHPNQISLWKQEFIENPAMIFKKKNSGKDKFAEQDAEKLYSEIGRLEMENDFLKKT